MTYEVWLLSIFFLLLTPPPKTNWVINHRCKQEEVTPPLTFLEGCVPVFVCTTVTYGGTANGLARTFTRVTGQLVGPQGCGRIDVTVSLAALIVSFYVIENWLSREWRHESVFYASVVFVFILWQWLAKSFFFFQFLSFVLFYSSLTLCPVKLSTFFPVVKTGTCCFFLRFRICFYWIVSKIKTWSRG